MNCQTDLTLRWVGVGSCGKQHLEIEAIAVYDRNTFLVLNREAELLTFNTKMSNNYVGDYYTGTTDSFTIPGFYL